MKTIVLTIATLTALAGTATAAPMIAPAPTATAKKAPLICPVTGTKIASAAKAFGHETYKGTTYYFCCPECKPRFDKAPAKIVADAAKGKYEKM